MFGCEAISDWNVGSPLLWKGVYEGQEMINVKGHVVAFEPETFLAYTTIDPNSDIADVPENYLTVTYDVSEENGLTTLTVTQGDYATVANGEQRYNDTIQEGGWNSVLLDIKQLLETDKS